MAGFLITVVCATTAATIGARLAHREQYLALNTTIPEGAPIVASDLVVVSMAKSSVLRPLPADDLASVVGRRAGTLLPAGSLLVSADLTTAWSQREGTALVGASLSANELPGTGLYPGSIVLVVETASTDAGLTSRSSAASQVLASATVRAVSDGSGQNGDQTAVTLEVPTDAAAAVAAASASNAIALADLGSSSGRRQ